MNILLTSVGRRSYLVEYFKEALNGIGLVHAANSEATLATSLADKSVIAPAIYNESYIGFLTDYCTKHNIGAIISLFDIDLPVLAKHRDVFERMGVELVVSDVKVTEICNDKWLTYHFLKDNGFSTPISFIDLEESKTSLAEGEIDFPVIIKPRWGMGSIGIFEAENMEELEILFLKTKRALQKTYLKFESAADMDRAVIIQEKLLGQEYGIDVFNDFEKNHICTIPKQKIAMRAGETDIAEIIADTGLEDLGRQLAGMLQHIGNLDVDVFLVNNQYYVLELNARFGGQYPFSHLAGANFPKIIVDLLLGKDIDITDTKVTSPLRGYKDLVIRKYE